MSPAERTAAPADAAAALEHAAVRPALRLFRSELGLIFGRRRNQMMLAVLAIFPVVIGVAIRLSTADGEAPNFIARIAGNGLFLTLASLTALLPLILPLAVSVVSGESISGEAHIGTLRYLITVPAGRTRLLFEKYAAAVVFCLAATGIVAVAGLLTGVALFPVGDVTLLSGTMIPMSEGLVRLTLVTGYVAAGMAALAAVGLFVSALTDTPIAAMAATALFAVIMQVLSVVPQLSPIRPYLLTRWWMGYDGFLRDPMNLDDVGTGLFAFGAYALIFASLAWARFTTRDITA